MQIKRKKLPLAIVAIAILVLTDRAGAQFTHNFLPTTSGLHYISTASNWDTNSVPNSASHFVRFNNPPADSTAANAYLEVNNDVTLGGFDINALSANVQINTFHRYLRLTPAVPFTSTVAPGRRLQLYPGTLTGNANATLQVDGELDATAIENLSVINTGYIGRGRPINLTGVTLQQINISGGGSVYADEITSSTISGGRIRSGNNGTKYRNSTISNAQLNGYPNSHVVPSGATTTFNEIEADNLSIQANATAVFQGMILMFGDGTLNNYGTITLDNGRIAGTPFKNNAGATINGRGILTSSIQNTGGTITASTGNIETQQYTTITGGRIIAAGGNFIHAGNVQSATLSGSQDHVQLGSVFASGPMTFSSNTIDPGTTLRLTGPGNSHRLSGNSIINGTLVHEWASRILGGSMTGSGQIINQSAQNLIIGDPSIATPIEGGRVNIGVANFRNEGLVSAYNAAFTGNSLDNTNGRILMPRSVGYLSLNTNLTGGSIEASGNSYSIYYDGGSVMAALLDRGKHHVRADLRLEDVIIDVDATLHIDSSAQTTIRGTLTNNGTIQGDITLVNGAALLGTGTHQGNINSLNSYDTGGTQNVASLVVGSAGTSGTDIVSIAAGTSIVSQSPVSVSSDGVLQVDATSSLQSSSLLLAGVLQLNGTFVGNVHLASGGVVSGSGSVQGTVFAADGSVISIGNSPGGLVVDDFVFESGMQTYEFEINNAAGAAGSAWDLLSVDGNLEFEPGATVHIDLVSLTAANEIGTLANFDSAGAYSWTLAEANSISGFSSSSFAVDTSAFANEFTGEFSVQQDANKIQLLYMPTASSGDFNFDGVVDAADYVMWRKSNAGNMGQYQTWRENFASISSGAGGLADGSAQAGVPEPASAIVLLTAIATLCVTRFARTSW